MRKVLLSVVVVSVIIATLLIASAGARSETRFTVLERLTSGRTHRAHRRLVVIQRGQLFAHHRQVGRAALRFNIPGERAFRFRAHFRGEGSLKARGMCGRGRNDNLRRCNRFVIYGGSGAFNGAAGKLKFHKGRGPLGIRLEFTFVQ